MTTNLPVLVPVVGVVDYPEYRLTVTSVFAFASAGVFGTLLGRVCLYASIERIGASRTAPNASSRAIVATLLGILLLGETLEFAHGLGVLLIVVGVTVIAWVVERDERGEVSRNDRGGQLLLPFASAIAYG